MDITLLCEDTFDGMMSAVYDGWVKMNKGHTIHIRPGEVYEYSFLTEYVRVETNLEKVKKVADSIRKKISPDAYMMVYRTCMHYEEDRVDIVVDFLKLGYKVGAKVTKDFGNPVVMKLVEYSRKVGNETHLFKGFVRFKEVQGNILLSRISPKCDVLPMISHHFSNRYPLENWIIYDDTRKKALVHGKGMKCILLSGNDVEEKVKKLNASDTYEDLWKVFFDTIGIKERENSRCQKTNLPKWYREHMTEFTENVHNDEKI